MKALLLYIIFAYLALTVQSIFLHGIKPDLALVLVCFYSVRYGQVKGVTYGALTGILLDTANGFIFGPHIISKSIAAFLISAVKENLFEWNATISVITIAIFSVVNIFLVHICFETFSKVSFADRPWGISVMEVIYTILSALVMFPVFNRERRKWKR
ncbi:MAG: rod shape-determining protein MreD [Nitrospirae bacterium]|nr:rod shape-determining protein MreD [Nitrospirota bacterium]